jgi:DNA primase
MAATRATRERIDFSFVKEQADFLAVLQHYNLEPKGRGVQRTLHCPFHADTQPSLKVNLGRKVFHCFGCGAKGNILEFVADMEEVGRKPEEGLRQAAETLALICGIQAAPAEVIPLRSHRKPAERASEPGATNESADPLSPRLGHPGAPEEPSRNEPLPTEFIERFEAKLLRDHPYLGERGLTPALIKTFGLGYYPDEPKRMMLRNRLCIPIRNCDGALLAYAGRWVGPDETIPEDKGKYELPRGFRKELELYNLERVKGHRHLIVVEGYFSVICLHALGVPAVALMGHTFSAQQLALLERCGVTRLTFLLDGDEAGRNAVPAIMERIGQSSLLAKFAVLPEGTQPDTLPEQTLRALLGRS